MDAAAVGTSTVMPTGANGKGIETQISQYVAGERTLPEYAERP